MDERHHEASVDVLRVASESGVRKGQILSRETGTGIVGADEGAALENEKVEVAAVEARAVNEEGQKIERVEVGKKGLAARMAVDVIVTAVEVLRTTRTERLKRNRHHHYQSSRRRMAMVMSELRVLEFIVMSMTLSRNLSEVINSWNHLLNYCNDLFYNSSSFDSVADCYVKIQAGRILSF
jgi:hypothetical protein